MTKEEAISYLQQLYPNGGHCWLDEQRIEAIGMAINALQEEPVSEELEDAATKYAQDKYMPVQTSQAFKAGAQWQHNQLEKNRIKACDRATKEEIEREQDFCDKIIIDEHRLPTYSDAIEYGIEWQKNQGVTKETVIGMATEELSINVSQHTLDALDLYPGDEVIIQIRKKED